MGLYDNIVCDYPLRPEHVRLDGWQTKDTPSQYLETYVITADGRLLYEDYDTVDLSKHTLENHGEGCKKISCLGGMASRENRHLVEVDPPFSGEISFYTCETRDGTYIQGTEVEYKAEFENNQLTSIHCVITGDDFTDWVLDEQRKAENGET